MLNKKEFAAVLAKKGYTKKDADIIMTDFISTLTELMGEGESVHFTGFGTFAVRENAPKKIKTMQGEEKIIEPFLSPKFTPASNLKRVVKEGFVRK